MVLFLVLDGDIFSITRSGVCNVDYRLSLVWKHRGGLQRGKVSGGKHRLSKDVGGRIVIVVQPWR